MIQQGENITNKAPVAYIIFLSVAVIGLPLSRFLMSLSQILLLLLWIFYGFNVERIKKTAKEKGIFTGIAAAFRSLGSNISGRFSMYLHNKPAIIFSSIYLMHLLGLLYTSNFHYAFKDLRIKLPILLFPLIMAGLPKLNFKQVKTIFTVFILTLTFGIILSFIKYFKGDYTDVRELSPFISPIRYSLNVLLGIFILIYFMLYDKTVSKPLKLLSLLLTGVFFYFLTIIESITALGIFTVIVFVFAILHLSKLKSRFLKLSIATVLIVIPVVFAYDVYTIVEKAITVPEIDIKKLDKYTARGNKYVHNLKMGIEDGKYVGIYICPKELKEEWNKRSKLDYEGVTEGGEKLKYVLIRYLTSKGLRKDASGVDSLTDWDIRKIEEGVANINYITHPGIKSRVLKIILGYERYKKSGDPSGNSVMQRYEYLKGSFLLIKKHPLLGVGTGDFEDILFAEYKEIGSKLKKKYIFHPHNQFVSITIMFGILGLLWFLYSLFYPPVKLKAFDDYFFLSFFIMIILSMLSDDTMDTQAGATFFAFFYTFLLFAKKDKKTLYLSE